MKYEKIIICMCCCLLFFLKGVFAQETVKEKRPGNQLMLIMSHSHIFEGVDESGNKKWMTAPSWGLDYNYWLGEHWAIGLHTDIIIENFSVENKDDEIIERTKPFAAVPSVVYKLKEHSAFTMGMGAEFAREGNFALTSIGYEYGWELPKHWELSASLTYDIKWNGYDTWIMGVGISKFFGRK